MTEIYCAKTNPPEATNPYYVDEFESELVIFFEKSDNLFFKNGSYSPVGYIPHVGRYHEYEKEEGCIREYGWWADENLKVINNVEKWMVSPL